MGFAEAAAAIRQRFDTLVGTPNDLVVHHDNGPTPGVRSSWYRMRFECRDTVQVSTGGASRRFRTEGVARVEMHVPAESGDGALLEIADAITTAFRRAAIADPDIQFRAPSLIGAATRVEAWFRREVEIPFRFDEVGA